MKHIAARAVAVLISLMLVVSAAAQQDQAKGKKSGKSGGGNVEEQIKKMEQDRAQAVVKGDAATLEKLTADDYMFIDRFGNVSDKASTMSRIKSGDIKLTSYQPRIIQENTTARKWSAKKRPRFLPIPAFSKSATSSRPVKIKASHRRPKAR